MGSGLAKLYKAQRVAQQYTFVPSKFSTDCARNQIASLVGGGGECTGSESCVCVCV